MPPVILTDIQQGTPEWLALRCGIVTASEISNIITPEGKPSKSEKYINQLLAEWVIGRPLTDFQSGWMERGHEIEDEARNWYALMRDVEPQTVGFVYSDDDRMVGCSPDALIGDDGMLEIKAPSPWWQMAYLRDGKVPKTYRPQTQGQLYVTGRRWCDFLAYHPDLPPLLVRAHRDEAYIAALDKLVRAFVRDLLAARTELERRGISRRVA